MRVVQVTPDFPPRYGGVGRHVHELSRGLVEHGFEVDIVTMASSNRKPVGQFLDEEVSVARLPSYTVGLEFPDPRIFARFDFGDADLIHAHSYQSLLTFLATLKRPPEVPLVISPHYHPIGATAVATFLRYYYRPLGALMLRTAAAVVCVSEVERRQLLHSFPLRGQRLLRIPCGVDTTKFRKIRDPSGKGDSFNLLYVGRLEKYKGILQLLKCFLQLLNNFRELTLTIAGSGSLDAAVREFIRTKGLDAKVTFQGRVTDDELVSLYSNAGMLVLPSQYEAFGYSVAEAMACETPVVATAVGGLPELVEDGLTGFLVPWPVTEQTLAIGIERLAKDPELSRKMGKRGRTRVSRLFRIEDSVREHERLYELLVTG